MLMITEDMIDMRRQTLLEGTIAFLHDQLGKFREGTTCTFECDSILLGALTKQMDCHSLLQPRPSKPFDGWSFLAVSKIINGFQSPSWCKLPAEDHGSSDENIPDRSQYGDGWSDEKFLHEKPKASKKRLRKKKPYHDGWGMAKVHSSFLEADICRCSLHAHLTPTVSAFKATVEGLHLERDLGYPTNGSSDVRMVGAKRL